MNVRKPGASTVILCVCVTTASFGTHCVIIWVPRESQQSISKLRHPLRFPPRAVSRLGRPQAMLSEGRAEERASEGNAKSSLVSKTQSSTTKIGFLFFSHFNISGIPQLSPLPYHPAVSYISSPSTTLCVLTKKAQEVLNPLQNYRLFRELILKHSMRDILLSSSFSLSDSTRVMIIHQRGERVDHQLASAESFGLASGYGLPLIFISASADLLGTCLNRRYTTLSSPPLDYLDDSRTSF